VDLSWRLLLVGFYSHPSVFMSSSRFSASYWRTIFLSSNASMISQIVSPAISAALDRVVFPFLYSSRAFLSVHSFVWCSRALSRMVDLSTFSSWAICSICLMRSFGSRADMTCDGFFNLITCLQHKITSTYLNRPMKAS